MTRHLHLARCAAIALTVATVLSGTKAEARDGSGSPPEALAETQQQLAVRLTAVGIGQTPPLLSNPADAILLRAALDPSGLRPVTAANLGEGLDSCGVANRYNVTLMFVGSRKDELKGVAPEDAARIIAERSRQNAVRYQDELALSMRFTAACMARLVEPAADFWEALPPADRTRIRLDGLRQIRQGMANFYIGLIMSQADPSSRPTNRALMLEALLVNNRRLGQALTPDDRTRVITAINGYLPGMTGVSKADLERLRDELATIPCLQLCPL
jgi:hypothetical protein